MSAMQTLLTFRRLYPALQEHRQVEAETLRLLRATLEAPYLARMPLSSGMLKYARRHFFSILFLAVYRSIGIAPEQRLLYGKINHAIRGIVTGTDNLLDDEYKEMLPLAFPDKATRFKSVMHILLFDRILFGFLEEAAARGLLSAAQAKRVGHDVFSAMVPIGAEEASEEGGVSKILSPSEILASVHMYKGGNLLRLAFVAPLLIERGDIRARLKLADRGIFSIGLALQVIDDLTDFFDDLGNRRHNYLAATIEYEGSAEERVRLAALLANGVQPQMSVESGFAESASRAMTRAIGEALDGFERLHEAGFWLDRVQALELIRYLFNLRGVGHLLALLPRGDHFSQTLVVNHAA